MNPTSRHLPLFLPLGQEFFLPIFSYPFEQKCKIISYNKINMFNMARIRKEILDFQEGEINEFDNKIALYEENETHLKAYIHGPKGTIYEGGFFQLDVRYPVQYPYRPLKIKFQTKVWHPNISSQTGAISLDILGTQWCPALTLRTTLLSVQSLLSSPFPNDPQDVVPAQEYKQNLDIFENHAQQWVEKYARYEIYEQKVQRLVEIGLSKKQSEDLLMSCGFDLEKAQEYISK